MSEATAPSPGPLPQCHGRKAFQSPKKIKRSVWAIEKNQSTDFKLCNFANGNSKSQGCYDLFFYGLKLRQTKPSD